MLGKGLISTPVLLETTELFLCVVQVSVYPFSV